MTLELNGKVAIVTGGASGIGLASARLLAAKGAKIVVADLNPERAKAARDAIAAAGGTALDVATDVGEAAAVRRLVERTVAEYGRIDILLHAAGICPRRTFLEMTDEEWRDVLRINLDGSFYITRDVARVMKEQGSGTMVLITSDRGIFGSVDYAHYAASKGGMIALTRSLALVLGKHGITVNAINPGMTDTPLARAANPNWADKLALDALGKASEPEEIAETVLFLAGTAGRYMTGQLVSTRIRFGS